MLAWGKLYFDFQSFSVRRFVVLEDLRALHMVIAQSSFATFSRTFPKYLRKASNKFSAVDRSILGIFTRRSSSHFASIIFMGWSLRF